MFLESAKSHPFMAVAEVNHGMNCVDVRMSVVP